MTTVAQRLGVLCVVVAGMWGSFDLLETRAHTRSVTVVFQPVTLEDGTTRSTPSPIQPVAESPPHPVTANHSVATPRAITTKTTSPRTTVTDVKRRGSITVLIPHSIASYFLYRGEQMGFEYELASAFAKELGVELEVRIPPPGTTITTWLAEGKGDIAAGLAISDERDLALFRTSASYLDTSVQLLTLSEHVNMREAASLSGKSVAVQPDAVYARPLLLTLDAPSPPPSWVAVHAEENIGGAVRLMKQRQTAAALVTAPFADLAHKLYPGRLRTAFTFEQPVQMVWAVRPENAGLLNEINAFFARAARSGLRKILFEKYFVTASHLKDGMQTQDFTLLSRRLSRYDRLIARHAEEAGFDWRFIAALIFEESRFDHGRVSEAGAYGLMQITPVAAQDIGVNDYSQPTNNIEAGIKYLKFLTRQFPEGRPEDRFALVLASYVMGLGHVEDARRLARTLGYDPDCWDDSLERVVPLLEKAKYHRRTRHGAAQGREAVRYVNAILKRYTLYSQYVSRELPQPTKRGKGKHQAASAAG